MHEPKNDLELTERRYMKSLQLTDENKMDLSELRPDVNKNAVSWESLIPESQGPPTSGRIRYFPF
jgi:hypothetical protein